MIPELERILTVLNELGEKYGPFQGVTFAANGQCRAVWAHRTEQVTLAELRHLVGQLPPIPDWQMKLGQALAHQARGELAEARALELEATDELLTLAYQQTPPAGT